MTTPLDLGPIKEREARATRGEWHATFRSIRGEDLGQETFAEIHVAIDNESEHILFDACGAPASDYAREKGKANVLFVKHARTDITLLVAEVERLRAEAEAEERSHGQTIDDRDALHERIDEIADALGDETEWSNVNDRGANALDLANEAVNRLANLSIAVDPVRLWFDGDGEIEPPSDVAIVEMAVEELQKDREEVQRLRTALHQILSATSEPVVKKFAEYALK